MMQKLYDDNKVYKLHRKVEKSPKDYHDSIIHEVPLNDLYEVVDYLYLNDKQEFCPVLLLIKDKDLIE